MLGFICSQNNAEVTMNSSSIYVNAEFEGSLVGLIASVESAVNILNSTIQMNI